MNWEITGPTAALVAGVITSLHCVGMCGPLACAACGPSRNPAAVWIYQLGRLGAYTLVGSFAGLVGSRVSSALSQGATRWMAWVFVGFFLIVALGLDKKIRWPALPLPVALRDPSRGACARAGLLGACTPALPCAPLYLVLAAAAVTGSPWSGGVLLLAFGLGTLPLLALAQSGLSRAQSRFSPATMEWIRRGLALAAVGVLLVRSWVPASSGCPMCH